MQDYDCAFENKVLNFFIEAVQQCAILTEENGLFFGVPPREWINFEDCLLQRARDLQVDGAPYVLQMATKINAFPIDAPRVTPDELKHWAVLQHRDMRVFESNQKMPVIVFESGECMSYSLATRKIVLVIGYEEIELRPSLELGYKTREELIDGKAHDYRAVLVPCAYPGELFFMTKFYFTHFNAF